jgi:flagellar hook assembly protein FlgD
MAFFFKKGVPSSVEQVMELDSTKVLLHEFQYTSTLFEGSMASAKIGPAKKWDNVLRRGTSLDATPGDTTGVEIYGIRFDNTESFLGTAKGDTSLANLNATEFPYIRLVLRNRDNVHTTPEQLRYWRVLYELVPEAALNPNRHFVFNDSVGQGQVSRFEVAIENLTELPLDSMLVQYQVIDKSKNKNLVASKRYFPIPVYDTIHAVIDIPSRNYPGQNLLFIEANPNNDQLEQFHPNNIGYKDWYVAPDKQNPLIDVTFDGVHIMDKDIVSSRPFINIILRDENKYLALDDTSLVGVYMKYPGDDPTAERYIPFDGTILKFIPADLGDPKNKNVARIEYRPTFLVDGNDYILTVKGKDKSGNQSGNNAYKVGFEIVNKPAISSVINYPNPFTTSTQFIFTITGAEIPSQLKIQIIAPSGKVVKEILKSDLGPLHIGTNMTEYKWRGDDQYGQPLANGVYLYRVVANLNGQQMDHYKRSATQNADKWIEKGYGKLYIMR